MSGQNSSDWEDLLRAGFSVRNGILHRESGLCALEELVIPSGVIGIDSGCFRGSPVLRSVTLPETLTELGASAFEDCAALEEILIPSGITRVRNKTFSGCRALRRIALPTSVTSIGEWAFRGCTALEQALLPDSVTEICAEVFLACPGLTILAPKDSAAERFARQFAIPFREAKPN